jgi:hypothetical protein
VSNCIEARLAVIVTGLAVKVPLAGISGLPLR